MITKSIRLTESEAADLRAVVERTGETEAALLKRAALEGLHARSLSDAITAYVMGRADIDEAARMARVGRAELLRELAQRGVSLLRGPSTVLAELEDFSVETQDERLRTALACAAAGETVVRAGAPASEP